MIQCTYANLPFFLLQLALTIVYIAVGVFAAGWIGKIKSSSKLIMGKCVLLDIEFISVALLMGFLFFYSR